jgi:hypothetical protein
LIIAGACLVVSLAGSASQAEGVAPTKAAPQTFIGSPQAPRVLYQGTPFTPQPVAPPTPILQRPAMSTPQASAQGWSNPCACYYPQGSCPFPSGNCALPQGNCVAPAPQYYGPAPSGQWLGASPQDGY